MTKTLVIIAIIIVVLIGFIVSIYNRLIRMIEEVNNNKHQIDIQLDRRFKVFESLIDVVKKYMNYEQTTLKDVVALRNQAQQAAATGDAKGQIAAENQISQIARGINVVFEQYPDLKANQNALQLQEEIVNTENKLTYAKQAYNDSIERYNAEKKSFFQAMIVNLFRSALDKTFEYWQLDEKTIAQQEQYTVKL
jgi:LemA protein